jgi:hypothetical protein
MSAPWLLKIHLNGGQTIVTQSHYPEDFEEDDVVAALETRYAKRGATPLRRIENVLVHAGAISAFEVEEL